MTLSDVKEKLDEHLSGWRSAGGVIKSGDSRSLAEQYGLMPPLCNEDVVVIEVYYTEGRKIVTMALNSLEDGFVTAAEKDKCFENYKIIYTKL